MTIAERLGVNRVVVALAFARLTDAIGNSMMAVVLPLYVADLPSPLFDLPTAFLVGLLISFYGIVNTVLQPFMGVLADRVGSRKRVIQIGLVLMSLGTLSFVLAEQYSHLFLIRGLQGIGVAMTVPATLALMTAASVKSTRGGSMGVYSTARLVGFALGPLMGGFLFDHFGFVTVFVVGAALVMLGWLLVTRWVNEDELPARELPKKNEPFKMFDRSIWSKEVMGLGLATIAMTICYSMLAALENEFNAKLAQTAFGFGFAFSGLAVGRLLFQIPIGRLSDRIGRKPVIIRGLIAMAPATIFLGYATTTGMLAMGRFLQGMTSAAISSPAFALVGDMAQAGGEARQMSVVSTGFFVGAAIGPLIAGGLVHVWFQLPFVVGAVLCVLGAVLVYRVVPETITSRPVDPT